MSTHSRFYVPALLMMSACGSASDDGGVAIKASTKTNVGIVGQRLISRGTNDYDGSAFSGVGLLEGPGDKQCTAARVSQHFVLTASHCLGSSFGTDFPPKIGLFTTKAYSFNTRAVATGGGGYQSDYAYVLGTTSYTDVALVHFNELASSKAPIYGFKGYYPSVATNANAIVVGYGDTDGTARADSTRRWGFTKVSANTNSKKALQGQLLETNFGQHVAGTCHGDSGGPVFMEGQAGNIEAVISSSDNAANCVESAGYAVRLDAQNFSLQIQNKINQYDPPNVNTVGVGQVPRGIGKGPVSSNPLQVGSAFAGTLPPIIIVGRSKVIQQLIFSAPLLPVSTKSYIAGVADSAADLVGALLYNVNSATNPDPSHTSVLGSIDGVYGANGNQYIQGWACDFGNSNAMTVNLYTGGSEGSGQLYAGFQANAAADDSNVSSACGSTTGHRFYVPISGDIFARAGQSIYMYGVPLTSTDANTVLAGSGKFVVPSTSVSGSLMSIMGATAAGDVYDSSGAGQLQVQIFVDGLRGMGAETGTLVWTGNVDPESHTFQAQLPQWVVTSSQNGAHSLSAYAVNSSGALIPLRGSPQISDERDFVTTLTFTTASKTQAGIMQTRGIEPGNFVGLSGNISLDNSSSQFAEAAFSVAYLPSTASCPNYVTVGALPNDAVILWQDTLRSDQQGKSSASVNFTLPYPQRVDGCMLTAVGGAAAGGGNLTVLASITVVSSPSSEARTSQPISLGNEFSFGASYGQRSETNSASGPDFATVVPLNQYVNPSIITGIVGNVSASPLGVGYGTYPDGSWIAYDDVYVYHASDCAQFPQGSSVNGPGNYYGNIPANANKLVAGSQLIPSGGTAPEQTISYLQPGYMNGVSIYQPVSYQVQPGDCLVSLTSVSDTSNAYNNAPALTAYLSCIPNDPSSVMLKAAYACQVNGAVTTVPVDDGCGNVSTFACGSTSQIAQVDYYSPSTPSGAGRNLNLFFDNGIQRVLVQFTVPQTYSATDILSATLLIETTSPYGDGAGIADLQLGANANVTWDANTVTYDNAPSRLAVEQDIFGTTNDSNYASAVLFDVTEDWKLSLKSGSSTGWYIITQSNEVTVGPTPTLLVRLKDSR